MRRPVYLVVSAFAAALIVACSDSTQPTGLVASGAGMASSDRSASAIDGSIRSVIMHDVCDSATFDAAVGPGTCVRQGGMKFDQFIAQLTRHMYVQGYDFSPPAFNAPSGQTIVATNKGGETHTFTRVATFGGGIVPLLNQLSGNPTVAPECAALTPGDFVAPGAAFTTSVTGSGPEFFQCCIHPWMRVIVNG